MGVQSGSRVDRYLLQERLGAGSFGEVWKASQLVDGSDLGIHCAIKLMKLTPDLTASSPRSAASGWLEEVRNLHRVVVDAVPRVYEANVWNDHAYIAMELLEGVTLGRRVERSPIPWRRALYIADQIATALQAAHRLEIVHRDLKPQNIMLVGARRVCVIDWGIARLRDPGGHAMPGVAPRPSDDVNATDDAPVTPIVAPPCHRSAAGTPGYMAPELYEGAHSSFAQDVFALGVVLYEMIAGRLPHAVPPLTGARTPEAVKAHRAALDKATMDHAMVPLQQRCPEVPKVVAQFVDHVLLAREPERRPLSPRNALEAVSRFPHSTPDPPYAGLGRMGPEYAGMYFGQKAAIRHVLEQLESQRAALLWGPSGTGKSSLAIAGVASTMDRQLFKDTDGWDIHVIRPREAQGFRVVPDREPSAAAAIGQVVVIDQLEEVVDLPPDAREVFVAAVLALLDHAAPVAIRDTVIGAPQEVRLIATIRDDLEWLVDREVPALRPVLERRIIVKGVDANFARTMIEGPARALDHDVEGLDAVSREVEECLAAEPAKLPVVQYALSEWWERRDKARKLLPAAAWHELGGVDGALSFVAEQFFELLDPVRQLCVRELFVKLFRGGRKQSVAESSLSPMEREMIDELVGLRLVGRREKKTSSPSYEVEHESLAHHWARLATWLAEARVDQALIEDLERDAAAYLRDPDPDRLWKRGRMLAVAEMERPGRIALSDNAMLFLRHARRRAWRSRLVGIGSLLAIVTAFVAMENWVTRDDRLRLKAKETKAEAKEADADAKTADAHDSVAKAEKARIAAIARADVSSQEAEACSQAVTDLKQAKQALEQEQKEAAQNQAKLLKEAEDEAARCAGTADHGAPRVVLVPVLIDDDLDGQAIQKVMRANLTSIQACYERGLSAKPALSGTVTVRFFVDPQGGVRSPQPSGVDTDVAKCIADLIGTLKFPRGSIGAYVTYSFGLKPKA